MEQKVKIPRQKTKKDLFLELIEKNNGIISIEETCKWLYGKYTKDTHSLALSIVRGFCTGKRYPINVSYVKEEKSFVQPKLIKNEKKRNDFSESIVRKGERDTSSKMEYMNNFTRDWIENDPQNKAMKHTIKILYAQLFEKQLDIATKISLDKSYNKLIEEKRGGGK